MWTSLLLLMVAEINKASGRWIQNFDNLNSPTVYEILSNEVFALDTWQIINVGSYTQYTTSYMCRVWSGIQKKFFPREYCFLKSNCNLWCHYVKCIRISIFTMVVLPLLEVKHTFDIHSLHCVSTYGIAFLVQDFDATLFCNCNWYPA